MLVVPKQSFCPLAHDSIYVNKMMVDHIESVDTYEMNACHVDQSNTQCVDNSKILELSVMQANEDVNRKK